MINWDAKVGKPHSIWLDDSVHISGHSSATNQGEVVKYFATRPQGALLFSQSTLSCKLRQHPEMEAHVDSIPNALSCKWPCIVTRPDVDCTLWLWVQRMDWKGEVVNSRMLMAKWEGFEKDLNVPEDERLPRPGWIQLFCITWVNWTDKIVTHIGIGTSSRRFRSMVKQDWLTLQLSKWNKLILRNFWLDFSQKIGGMLMSLHSLHLLHQIMSSCRGRWVESKPIRFGSLLPLHATQMALRKRLYSSLGRQRSLDALVDKAWPHVGFTIILIKQLGWQRCCLKSETINLNVFFSHWFAL